MGDMSYYQAVCYEMHMHVTGHYLLHIIEDILYRNKK